jgi:hypothetical protein
MPIVKPKVGLTSSNITIAYISADKRTNGTKKGIAKNANRLSFLVYV